MVLGRDNLDMPFKAAVSHVRFWLPDFSTFTLFLQYDSAVCKAMSRGQALSQSEKSLGRRGQTVRLAGLTF